jgi:hypothetical protein
VAYREDERLRLRVAELEEEVAAARRTIARLEGRPSAEGSVTQSLLGTPLELNAERSAAGPLDDAAAEAIVESLVDRYGVEGAAARIGRRLNWTGNLGANRMIEVTVTERDGRVRVRARERLSNLIGAMYGGIGGGVGGGFSFLPVMVSVYCGLHPAFAVIAWIVLVLAVTRAFVTRTSARRRAELDAAADDVAAALGGAGRARIGVDPRVVSEAVQAPDEDEAAAEEEAARAAVKRGETG